MSSAAQPTQHEINDKRQGEADEPRVVVSVDEQRAARAASTSLHGDEETRAGSAGSPRTSAIRRHEAEAVGETIFAIAVVERGDVQIAGGE